MMRKRFHIALAVLLVMLVGVMGWQLLRASREREPVYQGKRLSFWLRQYRTNWRPSDQETASARDEAQCAVQQIGTNAIPTLLTMLATKDSFVTSKLVGLWERRICRMEYLPFWVRYPGWFWNQAGTRNGNGASGFEILGTNAQQAVPALIRLYEQNISPRSQVATGRALNAIGATAQKMALPSFLREADSSDLMVRVAAVGALSCVDVEPQQVVPAVVRALRDTNWFTRQIAAIGLAHFGTNAQQAVPALASALSDTNTSVRTAAALSLKQIDPEAAAKAGLK